MHWFIMGDESHSPGVSVSLENTLLRHFQHSHTLTESRCHALYGLNFLSRQVTSLEDPSLLSHALPVTKAQHYRHSRPSLLHNLTDLESWMAWNIVPTPRNKPLHPWYAQAPPTRSPWPTVSFRCPQLGQSSMLKHAKILPYAIETMIHG